MAGTFAGKVVFITGGTTGIGRSTAVEFARHGAAAVVVTGRRPAEGEETVRRIVAAGGRGHFLPGDVASESAIEAAVAETVARFGRLDVAFNNAGVEGNTGKPLTEVEASDVDFVLGINVRGVILSMKHEFRHFAKQGGGVIINNSSIAGHIAFPGIAVYAASKHAVEGITKVAALEGAKMNVRVNCVAPGPIRTEMLDRFSGNNPDAMGGLVPMGRVGTGEEVAAAVLFLASDAASYVTGQSIAVDGGYLAT